MVEKFLDFGRNHHMYNPITPHKWDRREIPREERNSVQMTVGLDSHKLITKNIFALNVEYIALDYSGINTTFCASGYQRHGMLGLKGLSLWCFVCYSKKES